MDDFLKYFRLVALGKRDKQWCVGNDLGTDNEPGSGNFHHRV